MLDLKIIEAAQVIKQGGIIIAPAEGIYGFSCAFDDEKALDRIIKVKERDPHKGLIVISDTLIRALPLMDQKRIPPVCMMQMQDLWPGHNTFVVPAAPEISELLTGGMRTIAVRVTAFEVLRNLVEQVGKPIISTSANISGQKSTSDIAPLIECFKDKVDYILDLPCQGLKGSSAIYDGITGDILRARGGA